MKVAHIGGDPRSLYMRISDDCPGLYANDPAYYKETASIPSHGIIYEFKNRDYGQANRVCIVITRRVGAIEGDVEIWVTYNLAETAEHEGTLSDNVIFNTT